MKTPEIDINMKSDSDSKYFSEKKCLQRVNIDGVEGSSYRVLFN